MYELDLVRCQREVFWCADFVDDHRDSFGGLSQSDASMCEILLPTATSKMTELSFEVLKAGNLKADAAVMAEPAAPRWHKPEGGDARLDTRLISAKPWIKTQLEGRNGIKKKEGAEDSDEKEIWEEGEIP